MKILLLNENPVVSRLISLSAQKMSYEFKELGAYDEKDTEYYDVIVVDSQTPAPLKILKERCGKIIFLAQRTADIELEAQILYKPFLPTDFLNILNDKAIKLDDSIPVDELSEKIADIDLKAEDLNLDNLADESPNIDELSLEENQNTEHNNDELANLSFDEDERNERKEKANLLEQTQANTENETKPELEDTKQEFALKIENSQEQNEQEIQNENIENVTDEILQKQEIQSENIENTADEIPQEQEIKEQIVENEIIDESAENLQESQNQLDTQMPVVEEQEKELDFDDLPKDAEFLGQTTQEQNEQELFDEILPVLEEEKEIQNEDFDLNLSAHEQIQQELTQLDELEYEIPQEESAKILEDFKETPILDEQELGISDEDLVVPHFTGNDFDELEENDIKKALGEEIEIPNFALEKNEQNDEIVNELSKSIAGAITSSIKDETLKAVLKGMNMNIHININFDEGKH